MGIGIRPTGVDNAAAALRYLERRQEVVANNLANVSTDGFKGERAFARLLADGSTPTAETATDLRAGTLTTTNNPLDLAIAGKGFLVVQTPTGEKLTRSGALHIDEARRLVDATGNPVLGETDAHAGATAPILVPETVKSLTFSSSGAVMADGTQIGKLRVEDVPAGSKLQHEGNGLFTAPAGRAAVGDAERTVRQGMREESNVNSVEAMVDMIAVQRAYASVQKVMTTIDSARGIATTELGKPV